MVTYSSLVVWTALILPAPVARARTRLETRPVASLIAGIGFFLLTLLVYGGFLLVRHSWLVFLSNQLDQASASLQFGRFYNDVYILGNFVAWPLAAPAMAGWVIGGAGFAQMFATRARSLMHEDRPLLALVLGATSESLAFFLPAVGWFVFLPVVSLMSIGAGLLAVLKPHGHLATDGGLPGGKVAGQEEPAYESELASS